MADAQVSVKWGGAYPLPPPIGAARCRPLARVRSPHAAAAYPLDALASHPARLPAHPAVNPVPTEMCNTNPACVMRGWSTGACCPAPDGTMLSCCAQAKAHTNECSHDTYRTPDDAICPARTNIYDKCV